VNTLLGERSAVLSTQTPSSAPIVLPAALAALAAYAHWRGSDVASTLAALTLMGLLLAISLVDLAVHRIPNLLCVALLLWAGARCAWFRSPSLTSLALGLGLGGGLFLVLAVAGHGALGWGDVKLAAALGAVLGFRGAMLGLAWGMLAAGAWALLMLSVGLARPGERIAYGPFLAFGAWMAWLWTEGL
jgi:prepilin signal peptidase PulO-like enzyme (type II secretory pathway)